MAKRPDIDFERATILMDAVHKITTVAPRHTALLGMAMEELNAMQAAAADYLHVKGQEDLHASQEAKAKLNAATAEEAAQHEADQAVIRERTAKGAAVEAEIIKAEQAATDERIAKAQAIARDPNYVPSESTNGTPTVARRTLENTNG